MESETSSNQGDCSGSSHLISNIIFFLLFSILNWNSLAMQAHRRNITKKEINAFE